MVICILVGFVGASSSADRAACRSLKDSLATMPVSLFPNDRYASAGDAYNVAAFVKYDALAKRTPVVGPVEPSNFTSEKPHFDQVRVFDRSNEIGVFEFRLAEPEHLYIEIVKVDPSVQGVGLSEAMFARILNKHPEVREIEAEFIDKNRDLAMEKYRLNPDCRSALLETPTGKMGLRFGFTRVIEAICEPKGNNGRGYFSLIQGR